MDQLDNELERLLEIKDSKKLFANSIILTTHMLKNCVKVPKLYKQENAEDEFEEALSPDEFIKAK